MNTTLDNNPGQASSSVESDVLTNEVTASLTNKFLLILLQTSNPQNLYIFDFIN